jgi:hypothetical protein
MSIELNVLYEDEEVVVMKAPTDEELVELVYKYIKTKGRPVTWKELREEFSGTAGEDRLRKALSRLRREGLVIDLGGGRYATPDMPGVLEELEERKRKRIMREAASLEWRMRWRRARKRGQQPATSQTN